MAAAAHGRGYATEAVRAAHRWLAALRGAERTVCLIHPDNHRSQRVATKMGYRAFREVRYHDAPAILFERAADGGGSG